MNKIIKFTVAILFAIICLTTNYATAQEQAPSPQQLIAAGDREFANKEFIKAKTCYQEALRLNPNDATAKSKLDKTLNAIRQESKKDEEFYGYIDKADEFHNNGDLQNALLEYDKALKIKPNDDYANGKKNEIAQVLKDEKDKLDSFNNIMMLGDKLLAGEKFAEAVMQYETALNLYPTNNAAKAKLKEAKEKNEAYNLKVSEYERFKNQGKDFELRKKYTEAIESYQKAMEIFPEETELVSVVASIQSKKDIADRYNEKINAADAFYEDQAYQQAKTAYQDALTVINDDSYAQGMIARIDEIVNSDEYVNIQKEKAKLDNDFASYINKGVNAEGLNNFDLAITHYDKALELKPGNKEALAKKENAQNQLLRQQQLARERERQAAVEAERQRLANIQNMINAGNQQLNDKKYAEAELTFNELLKMDPGNATATEKLQVIAGFYEEIQRQKAENYQTAMAAGASAMEAKNYTEALKQFNIAIANKPGDETAMQQLAAAQQMEDIRLASLQNEYNALITKADAQFQGKSYDKAIEFYTKANNLNTGNPYPANKINEISEILIANKLADLVSESMTVNANQTKRFDFTPIDVTTRRNNYLFIKAKNLTDKQYTMYVSFGSPNGKNGGFMVTVPGNQEVNDFIIRIGAQYKWFSEDNTWIEVSPENGDVEIISMEISKSN